MNCHITVVGFFSFFNSRYVPEQYRVLYVNGITVIWDIFLSYIKHRHLILHIHIRINYYRRPLILIRRNNGITLFFGFCLFFSHRNYIFIFKWQQNKRKRSKKVLFSLMAQPLPPPPS